MKKLYMVLAVVLLMVITGCNKGGENATNQANLDQTNQDQANLDQVNPDQANQNQAYPNQVPAGTGNLNSQNSLPPPIYFSAPPEVVPVADTNVYTVPDVQEEIFFSGGWWWRPWNGRWYRSHYYDRGWGNYRGEPSFYRNFYSGWRDDFRHNRWRGQSWDYQRVPQRDLDRNWRTWERNRYWYGGGHGHRVGGYPDFKGERQQGFQGNRGIGQQGMQGNRGVGKPVVQGNRGVGQQGMQGNRGVGKPVVQGNRGVGQQGVQGNRGGVKPSVQGNRGGVQPGKQVVGHPSKQVDPNKKKDEIR